MTSTETDVRSYSALTGVSGHTTFSSKTSAEVQQELGEWVNVFRAKAVEEGFLTPTVVQFTLPPKQYYDLSSITGIFKRFEGTATFSPDRRLMAAGAQATDRMLISNFDYQIVIDGI